MKKHIAWTCLGVILTATAGAQTGQTPSIEEMWAIIQQQQKTIDALQARLDAQSEALADSRVEVQSQQEALAMVADQVEASAGDGAARGVKLGGYGELHYNNVDAGNKIDFHRFVLFAGYDFSDRTRFYSELELEHALSGDGEDGEVELEQAFIEHRLNDSTAITAGVSLVPVGILNETHEPDTFYGVERNPVESNIIPSTWWEAGLGLNKQLNDHLGFDVFVSSGLNTPIAGSNAFRIRSGRQKISNALANDGAVTARLRFNPFSGLQLAATYQMQQDLTQGALDIGARLFEINARYQRDAFALRALYAQWDLDSAVAAIDPSREKQRGYYLEPSYRFGGDREYGVFLRYSNWNNNAGVSDFADSKQLDVGLNYWLTPTTVFKFDYQEQSGAVDNDGFNLGVGYSF